MTESLIFRAKNRSNGQAAPIDNCFTCIVKDGKVTVVNTASYAMQKLQNEMKGEAEKAGFHSEEDAAEYITKLRHEKK